jgi:glycosyltransferase involved in cell wall biosynthesis
MMLHRRLDPQELPRGIASSRTCRLSQSRICSAAPFGGARLTAPIYHGLPEDLYSLETTSGRYLAFIGRISPEKRVDRAIEIAKRVGMPIRIAANIGEIGEREKKSCLAGRFALLYPIDWPEPFGLVLIEAMACGTPVMAFRNGSVPEIIEEGATGFVVTSIEEAVSAVRRVESLSRAECRRSFEQCFTASRMAKNYFAEYVQVQAPDYRNGCG